MVIIFWATLQNVLRAILRNLTSSNGSGTGGRRIMIRERRPRTSIVNTQHAIPTGDSAFTVDVENSRFASSLCCICDICMHYLENVTSYQKYDSVSQSMRIQAYSQNMPNFISIRLETTEPNKHRRRRRDSTVELNRVGVARCVLNSQLQLSTTAHVFGRKTEN